VLRRLPLRGGALLALLTLALVFIIVVGGGQDGRLALLPLLGSIVAMAVLIGPVRMSLDLRHDLDRIDLLRALPLTGRQIVLAEMIAPTAALALLQWILLAIAVAFGSDLGGLDLHARLAIALSAALVCPALTMVGMVVQNAAALLFPDWMAAFRERRRGFDAIGQRLLTLAGSVIVLAVGALPAAIVSGGLLWLLWSPLEWAAAPIAAAVATGALLIEVGIGAALLGKLFEAHDVSAS
jgi:ABC-2 type transport system permease protein